MQQRLIAGAMSGTSADGVDVAIVSIAGRGLQMSAKLLAHHHVPYAPQVRRSIFAARENGTISLAELAKLGREISLTYARTVSEALTGSQINASDLACIAAHGQTLFHDPPSTIQWFDPALVAAKVGCPVVSDFRRADCAAGGQGAPLVPYADYILFRHPTRNRVLLNIGGIANLTWLKAAGTLDEVIAFDTGPGNCVIDHYARRAGLTDGIDRDGKLCAQGNANFQTASVAIRNWGRVFHPPPKSTDVPEMIAAYENAVEVTQKPQLSLEDQLATACLTTALGVELALHHLKAHPDEIIVSGGGVRNPRLLAEIVGASKRNCIPVDEFGIPSEAKEAVAFALLAAATMDGEPSNVPSVTGAKRAVVLGSITPWSPLPPGEG
jgi:anhydro-N-acetylmuramic acid kinase